MAGEPTTPELLEALAEPALIVRSGKIRHANDAATRLLGQGLPNRDLRLAIRQPRALEHILSGKEGDVDVAGIGAAGRPWTISVRRLAGGDLLVRIVDQSAARAAERMRVDFVANASHELRTPLATILGYSETLADPSDLDAETRVRFGATVESEARRMLRIIEDLMSLSRIEADRFVAPDQIVEVADIVRFAAANCDPLAAERGVQVEVDLEKDLPQIHGDRAQLGQVLDNLLANALRYGCQDAGCSVTIDARRAGRAVAIRVADSGEGIAKEHLPRLTERFYRVDSARSRDSGGTGLGLAIVKHIVERHRGVLEIRSEPGVGTEVIVLLPTAVTEV